LQDSKDLYELAANIKANSSPSVQPYILEDVLVAVIKSWDVNSPKRVSNNNGKWIYSLGSTIIVIDQHVREYDKRNFLPIGRAFVVPALSGRVIQMTKTHALTWVGFHIELSERSDFIAELEIGKNTVKRVVYHDVKKVFFRAPWNGVPMFCLRNPCHLEIIGLSADVKIKVHGYYDFVPDIGRPEIMYLDDGWSIAYGILMRETLAKTKIFP